MKFRKTCRECNGHGTIEENVCISEWKPPTSHPKFDALMDIIDDAAKAKKDHARLCEMIPRAKESYNRQLAETLEKLEQAAITTLAKPD